MKFLIALQFCFWALLPALAGAHSVDALNEKLMASEKFFQPFNQPAPEFNLFDSNGAPVTLKDFQGKVVVAYFVYMSCPDICPLQTDFIAGLQETINDTPMRDKVAFVTITTDPVTDTPARMREFATERGLDAQNWTFLTSGPQQPEMARELVEQFGHSYQVIEDGYQIHGTVTHVIDKRGQWRGNFHGLNFQQSNIEMFINALVDETHTEDEDNTPSFLDRILSIFN